MTFRSFDFRAAPDSQFVENTNVNTPNDEYQIDKKKFERRTKVINDALAAVALARRRNGDRVLHHMRAALYDSPEWYESTQGRDSVSNEV
jgi:hypothetical protein